MNTDEHRSGFARKDIGSYSCSAGAVLVIVIDTILAPPGDYDYEHEETLVFLGIGGLSGSICVHLWFTLRTGRHE